MAQLTPQETGAASMPKESAARHPLSGEWLDDVVAGLFAYYITSLPVLLGVLFGASFVGRTVHADDPIAACVRFDAARHLDIIRNGYSYDPKEQSTVAFFPAYPLLARWLGLATGMAPDEAALLVANVSLMGAFIFLARWTRMRWPEATDDQRFFVLAVFGLWPMGFFFRMPYSESLFLFASLAMLYGMARRWPLVVLALLAGFLTAVRPVGVAATAAFLWHVLSQPGTRLRTRIGQAALLAPLACWGLLGYMLFQQLTFGNPFAFAQTQDHWNMGAPKDFTPQEKFWGLATLEPIRGIFDPNSDRFWQNLTPENSWIFNVMFWNPIFFVLATVFLTWGGLNRWCTATEFAFCVSLLAIPYLTRAYEMSMGSHGRFAAIVVFGYPVIGRTFAAASLPLQLAISVGLGTLSLSFTSLFCSNRLFF